MKFCRNFFLYFLFFLGDFLTTFQTKDKVTCAGNKHYWSSGETVLAQGTNPFGAGDERIENAHSNFSHTHTASHQRLQNRTYLEMIANHRYSPLKTGGSYHALVLSYEYATPTSYTRTAHTHVHVCNSILCWIKQ